MLSRFLAILLFISTLSLSAQHCLQGYRYRVPITITNPSASDTSGVVAINFDALGLVNSVKMQDKCIDLRFTDQFGNKLNYWVDNSNSVIGNRTAWVQLDNIPVGEHSIYMFYGNSTAISESTESVLDFIDHFEGTELDERWESCGDNNITVTNSSLTIGSNTNIFFNEATERNYNLYAYITHESGSDSKKTIGQITPDNAGYGLSYNPNDPLTSGDRFEVQAISNVLSCPQLNSRKIQNPNAYPIGEWSFNWMDNKTISIAPEMGTMPWNVDNVDNSTSTHYYAGVNGVGSMSIDYIIIHELRGKTITATLEAEESIGASVDITLSSNAPICSDSDLSIETNDIDGAIYSWKYNGVNIPTATEYYYTISAAKPENSGNYEVTVNIGGGSCPSKSDDINVVVDAHFDKGSITPDTRLCAENNNGAVVVSGHSSEIDYWKIKEGNNGIWLTQISQDSVYTYNNLQNTYSFIAHVSSGACGTGFTDTSTVFIDAKTDGGTLSEDATVCTGTTDTLRLSNYLGEIIDWQERTVGGSWMSTTPLFTGSAYEYSALTESTYYRTIVQNGVCANDTSNAVFVKVNPTTQPGLILGSKTICAANTATDTLVLDDYTGKILRWEFASTENGPWGVQPVTNDTFLYQGLNHNTYYQALVYSPGCDSAHSPVIEIIVDQKPTATTVLGSTEKCAGTNSGFVSLNSYSGKVVAWQSSNDGSSWDTIYRDFDTLNYQNLSANKWYRALVNSTNEVCTSVASDDAKITVSKATLHGDMYPDTILACIGSEMDTLRIRNYVGDILRWESSSNGNSPWTTINNTSDSLLINGLLSTNHYRAIVKSGACSEEIPTPTYVRIDDESYGGVTFGSTEVCEAINEGDINVMGPMGAIVKWEYKVNDNWTTVPNTTTPTISYTNLLDTTSYRAIVQNGVCPNDTSSISKITVNPLPDVVYTADEVNLGDATQFQNTSSIPGGFIQNWHWDFGNQESSSSHSPSYTYPEQGNYHVRLSATSNKGCIDSASQTVTVFGLPDVNFIANNTCRFTTTTFINTSNAAGDVQYIWDFGDNNRLMNNNDTIQYFYNNHGTFTVTLIAHSLTGGTDSVQKTVQVYPRSAPDFSFDDICEGQTAHFTNLTQSVTPFLSYEWLFHTGETDQRTDPDFTYTESNNFPVTLRVTTDNGCLDTLQKSIIINPNPSANFLVEDVPYQQASVFINTSEIRFGSMRYLWQFGDENSSDTTNPIHFYEAPGVYQVALTATSAKGCVGKANKAVKIFDLPVVKFAAQDVCHNDTTIFTNESSIPSGTLTFEWTFGDGNNSTVKEPRHLFDSPGTYEVRLISISNQGARDTAWKNISVYELPTVDFAFNEACDGLTTKFENHSNVNEGEIASVLWDFGDGSNSVQLNPEKDFLNPAIYKVNLNVLSTSGCSSDRTRDVIIHHNPVANFNVLPVCHNYTSEFNNESFIDNSNRPYTMLYQWDFDDNETSDQLNPDHRYSEAGVYQARLVVSTDAGCSDTLYRLAEVYSLPEANAGADTLAERGFSIGLAASGGTFYEWSPPDGLSNALSDIPDARPLETTTYTLRVTDDNGCINYDTMTVFVEDVMKIIPSNILTPNNNGENDTWSIVNIDAYPESDITIFDRWGKVVYKTTHYNNDWRGVNANGDILPDGTYYYIIILRAEKEVTYKGAITILRDK